MPPPGSLWVRRQVLSSELRNFRDLVVAVPPSYSEGDRRYPVVYLQDGQNLFDPRTSFARDWGLGPTLAGAGPEVIAVGIPNRGIGRLFEYSPFVDRTHGGGGGDRYLRFVTNTVKPLIDRRFRTLPDRLNTSIAGASMGGLISLYALYRFGEWFGSAGVISPALWFASRAIMRYVASWPEPQTGRIHLDIGLLEPRRAVADTRNLRNILVRAGLRPGIELDYVEDAAGAHTEDAWGRRFGRALPFLLGGSSRGT